jgi:hypothetical protein
MPNVQPADPESLRLELQEAIATFRNQLGLLTQLFGIVITADSALVAYAFSQKKSGIFLGASLMPIATGIVYAAIIKGLIPISYIIIRLEKKLLLREDAFMTTWIMTRYDLPFKTIKNIDDFDKPEVREPILQTGVLYLLIDPKMLTLAVAFLLQFTVFILSLTVFHYPLM